MSVPGAKVMGQEPSTTHDPELVVPTWHGTSVGDEGDVSASHILDILAREKGVGPGAPVLWAGSCSWGDLRNTSMGRKHSHPTSMYLG